MTAIINKDKDWLKEQIERGIEGFFECEGDYFNNLIMKYVYEQIFISGCAINGQNDVDEEGTLVIQLKIPLPDQCNEIVDGFCTKDVYKS